jgi:hypothetical protein
MRIVMPGGTGQVGTLLARAFVADGHEVVVLSRRPASAPWRVATWDPRMVGPWTAVLDGADVVINLAGRNVNCRYTPENRREIFDSRVESTKVVGHAIARCRKPPRVWLQASTATIYSHRFDAPNDDLTGVIGGREVEAPQSWRFSVEVATAWAGTFGVSSDGLPFIGRHPGVPHTWFALGFGGNGTTFSVIAAEIIRNALLGRDDPDAALFSFERP